MGSSENQSPWAPYDTYRDCSQGICSIYCPQWCYIIFPPPPPPSSFGEDDSGADFSPLIIAVIGILASAFILVSYFTLISKYCRRRGHDSSFVEFSENRDQANNGEAWPANISDGLDETLIKSITVCKYMKNDGFVESTDCSVCLSEFQENENLRLLPKCSHAFHIPCIDTWLKSHSNCPLCRAAITPAHIIPSNQTQSQAQAQAGNVQISALEYQNRNDSVVVIEDLEVGVCEDCVVDVPKTASEGTREDAVQTMRRSVSLNTGLCEAQVSIADILRLTEDDEDDDGLQLERLERNRDSVLNLVAMKRSISTGRFMLTRSEKGWSSTILN
ncbi:hypothetical protein HS088_TW15G00784 [Tripterygium wilfordii]|uniref:RING-type E3 ubiquitin transferase n=1 Tax=Tripterygium wilfordii TaxID=458696 RepID=A0A7J7CMH7_TRIWF|nr:hypothetical protein HS088_TW15G00784 [Tripterygium wilfordii]